MFSTTKHSLTKLNNAEKQELVLLEERIKQATTNVTSLSAIGASVKLTRELDSDDFTPRKVLKFSENGDIFKTFYDEQSKGMLNNIKLLKEMGYVGSKIESVDKQKKCTILNEYIGSFMLNEYAQKDNIFFLNEACKLNVYFALLTRCNLNVDKIKNGGESIGIKQQLDTDLALLSNLYWSVGSMHAAYVYLDLGNHLQNQGEDFAAAALDCHKRAAESFFSAAKLLQTEFPENKKIMAAIFQSQSIEEVYQFEDWEIAKSFFLKPLANNMTSIIECFDAANKKIDDALVLAKSNRVQPD